MLPLRKASTERTNRHDLTSRCLSRYFSGFFSTYLRSQLCYIDSGLDLFAALEAQQLEGMVAKRADSLYVPGRSKEWLKVKARVGSEQMRRRIESWGHR
jgi:hypothetical protein